MAGVQWQLKVHTDHKNLEYWKTAQQLNQRQIRWAEFFAGFNFKLEYVPEEQNARAHVLLRKPEYLEEQSPPTVKHTFESEQWQCAATVVNDRELQMLTADDGYARKKLAELSQGRSREGGFEE